MKKPSLKLEQITVKSFLTHIQTNLFEKIHGGRILQPKDKDHGATITIQDMNCETACGGPCPNTVLCTVPYC